MFNNDNPIEHRIEEVKTSVKKQIFHKNIGKLANTKKLNPMTTIQRWNTIEKGSRL